MSPDSVERDYEKKLIAYEEAGVPEYWIINEEEERFYLLRLSAKGKYQEVKPKKGVVKSDVLPGFSFKPEWLWMQPRPKKHLLMIEILGPRM